MNQESPVTVAILAGGRSSRMGQDKSFVLFQGRPLIEIVKSCVAGLGDETLLVTNKPDVYAHLNLPMVGDVYPDHGSLGGIFTAIHAAAHPHTLVVACDMPWLNRPFLQHLLNLRQTADIVVPRWEQYPEPLHAVYHKNCLPAIEENIKAGRLKITSFFGHVSVRFVEPEEIKQYDENGRSFANINTPTELLHLQHT